MKCPVVPSAGHLTGRGCGAVQAIMVSLPGHCQGTQRHSHTVSQCNPHIHDLKNSVDGRRRVVWMRFGSFGFIWVRGSGKGGHRRG